MTPTIDDIEAALPHVPAGLHCGDLTDERRAFAVTVHEIVVRAMRDVHPVIAATLQAVGEVLAHGGTVYTTANGHRLTLEWPQYRPGVDLSDANVDPAPVPPENQDGRNNGVSSWEPDPELEALLDEEEQIARERQTNPAPLVEWGVDEARVNWGPPKPGTHESDLRYDWKRLTAATLPGEHPYWGRGGFSEAGKAGRWSYEESAR